LKQQAYVGHEDSSGSIKYYAPKSRKILLSRNYHFLSISPSQNLAKEISITPDAIHEGGSGLSSMNDLGSREMRQMTSETEKEPDRHS
jgi:hypothetical protein